MTRAMTRAMPRSLLSVLSILCLLLAATFARAEDISPAEPLFAATLTDMDGQPAALSKYRGKLLIVNFWARWCPPCKAEIPDFIKTHAKYKSRGIEVVGIGIEDNAESVRDFAKAYEMNYPVVLAKSKGIWLMQALGNERAGLPYTVVIDRQGRIVSKKIGPMSLAELDAAAATLLK